ncbi:MAG: hypothetical protein ACHQRM_16895 [Bacteroidia bacterium]
MIINAILLSEHIPDFPELISGQGLSTLMLVSPSGIRKEFPLLRQIFFNTSDKLGICLDLRNKEGSGQLTEEELDLISLLLFSPAYLKQYNIPAIGLLSGIQTPVDESRRISTALLSALREQGFETVQCYMLAESASGKGTNNTCMYLKAGEILKNKKPENIILHLIRNEVELENPVFFGVESFKEAEMLNDWLGREEQDFEMQNPSLYARLMEQKKLMAECNRLKAENKLLNFKLDISEQSLLYLHKDTSYIVDWYKREHAEMQTWSKKESEAVKEWYRKEYEVLPSWYKKFGHLLKVISGKKKN